MLIQNRKISRFRVEADKTSDVKTTDFYIAV